MPPSMPAILMVCALPAEHLLECGRDACDDELYVARVPLGNAWLSPVGEYAG